MKLSIAVLATLLIHVQAGLKLNFTGDCTYDALLAAADDAGVTDLISRLTITGDADEAARRQKFYGNMLETPIAIQRGAHVRIYAST